MTNELKRPELSFDGRGINGPDEFRTRLATFSESADPAAVKRYGALFEAAPELYDSLKNSLQFIAIYQIDHPDRAEHAQHFMNAAQSAISKAAGQKD